MSSIGRFAAYAAAFEKAYDSDDWAPLAEFFTDDAVYVTGLEAFGGGEIVGRDAILAWFKRSLDALDRRFESRTLHPREAPSIEGDTVRIVGEARYAREGVPDFVLALEELLTFEDGCIVRLEDVYSDETRQAFEAYVERWGGTLGVALPITA